MKKIVRQQNYLKEIIDAQENKYISKQALRGVIRAVLEPLLDNPEESAVLYRITDPKNIAGLIKRLEFSETESYDFSDDSGNLREKVWARTEFICVLTRRFAAIVIWDDKTDNDNFVRYYSIYNSGFQNEALDIINRNVIVNIKRLQEKFRPDRRSNSLLNLSIRQLIENLDEAAKEAVLGFAEGQTREIGNNTPQVAHEIKNQLSICDLYGEIIKKYCIKNKIRSKTLLNAADCIKKAVQLGSSSLAELKVSHASNLEVCNLKNIIQNTNDLTKVYFEGRQIKYIVENNVDAEILADKDKFTAALINLIKNASEAFEDPSAKSYVKLSTEKDGDFVIIRVKNNGQAIENPKKIFDFGYTTKTNGTGFGLYICKKTVEDQYGQLKLEHTGKDYTEFSVKTGIV